MIGQDISGVLWWFGGWGEGGWNYRFYSNIEYTIIFFRRLQGYNYGIVIEICSYYDFSHAERFFRFVHVLCFLFYIHSKLGG